MNARPDASPVALRLSVTDLIESTTGRTRPNARAAAKKSGRNQLSGIGRIRSTNAHSRFHGCGILPAVVVSARSPALDVKVSEWLHVATAELVMTVESPGFQVPWPHRGDRQTCVRAPWRRQTSGTCSSAVTSIPFVYSTVSVQRVDNGVANLAIGRRIVSRRARATAGPSGTGDVPTCQRGHSDDSGFTHSEPLRHLVTMPATLPFLRIGPPELPSPTPIDSQFRA